MVLRITLIALPLSTGALRKGGMDSLVFAGTGEGSSLEVPYVVLPTEFED